MPLVYDGSFNGLAWGPLTDIHLVRIDGLTGSPPYRNADLARPGAHGAFYGRDLYASRTFTLTWNLVPRLAGNTIDTLAGQLADALAVQQQGSIPMFFNGNTLMINCRPLEWDAPRAVSNVDRWAVATAQFRAADPLIYDASETVLSLPLFVLGGGWVFPWVFPWVLSPAGGSSPGTATVFNQGSIDSAPSFRIPGPIDIGFELRNMTTGAVLQVARALTATDWIDVDMGLETVLFQSVADSRGTIVNGTDFWKLPPGSSTVRLAGLGSVVPVAGFIHYRSAYTSITG